MLKLFWPAVCLTCFIPTVARGIDAFDRQSLDDLRAVDKAQTPVAELSLRQAAELKLLGAGITSPCIVVKTDAGNWAKALLSWGLRKGVNGAKPTPVLMLDRYVTFDGTRKGVTTASGKDVMLFGDFSFDFDIGQVVPAGAGGDIQFLADRRITSAQGAKLFAIDGPTRPEATSEAAYDPNDHSEVLPRDFSGIWRLNADGRWRGVLDLTVDAKGNMDGTFLSDETQSSFPVIGKVDVSTNRAVLEIQLLVSHQLFEAYLWTSDKSTMAGITTLSERRFGFYAVREGTDDAPQAQPGAVAETPAETAVEPMPAGDLPVREDLSGGE